MDQLRQYNTTHTHIQMHIQRIQKVTVTQTRLWSLQDVKTPQPRHDLESLGSWCEKHSENNASVMREVSQFIQRQFWREGSTTSASFSSCQNVRSRASFVQGASLLRICWSFLCGSLTFAGPLGSWTPQFVDTSHALLLFLHCSNCPGRPD